jgi:hypothetical protein
MSIRERIEQVLDGLPPSTKLRELEKLSMKLRKENSIRIEGEVNKTRNKYPRIKR